MRARTDRVPGRRRGCNEKTPSSRRVVIAADFVLRGGTRKGGRPTGDRVVGHVMDKVGSKSVRPSVIHKRTTPLFDSCFSGNQTATSVTNDQKTEILVGEDQSPETVRSIPKLASCSDGKQEAVIAPGDRLAFACSGCRQSDGFGPCSRGGQQLRWRPRPWPVSRRVRRMYVV